MGVRGGYAVEGVGEGKGQKGGVSEEGGIHLRREGVNGGDLYRSGNGVCLILCRRGQWMGPV